MMKLAPYPEYKDSAVPWLGKIPAHWDLFRNGRLFSQRNETGFGELPILEVSLKTGIRVRDMENLKRKQVMSDREKYKRAAQGDIAYNMMRMWQGAVGVAPVDGLVSPAYVVVRPFPEVDCRYFSYLFRTASYMNEVDAYSRGIVKDRNRLYWQDFKRMPSPVPPIEEQRNITKFLDAVGSKAQRFIRNKQRLIELLKEQKQNIINQAVTRGLDPNVKLKPSGVEWIGDIPGHWEMRKITHLYRQIGSGTTPQSGNADYYDGNIPWIISGDLTDGFLETTSKKVTDKAVQDYSTLKMYPEGSLVVAMYGATIGKVSLTSIRACTNQACCVLSNPRNDINNKFMLQLFLKIKPDLVRMGYGGGQPNISQDTIKGLRLPIPSIEEQGDIVTFIENETATIDYAITHAKREIELMREYRTRLISDVVTGQVDVRGIEVPEVAEEELLALDEDTTDADDVIDDEGDMDETD
jgi:type I restriction enzyme S subunit